MQDDMNTPETEEHKDTADTTDQTYAEKPAGTAENKKPDADAPAIDGNTAKKIIYSLCYLWGILFFLPLILYKDDKAATRHANEGLLLLLLSVIGNVVFGVLSSFLWIFGLIAGIYSAALLVLGIVGIVYVVTDNDKKLPIIGGIVIIK